MSVILDLTDIGMSLKHLGMLLQGTVADNAVLQMKFRTNVSNFGKYIQIQGYKILP